MDRHMSWRDNVRAYFRARPMLGPGLVAEFTISIDDQGVLWLHEWNHGDLSDAQLITAMLDGMIAAIQQKGGDRETVLRYLAAQWPTAAAITREAMTPKPGSLA
jgi:hypothetical protein